MLEREDRERANPLQDLQRVLCEGQHGGSGPLLSSPLAEILKKRLVAEVDAVEIAHGDGPDRLRRSFSARGGEISVDSHSTLREAG